MKTARLLIIIIGVLLPYLARIPGGWEWLKQYTELPFGGWVFLGGFNAIVWLSLLGLTFLYRKPTSLFLPAISGFGFLAWAHSDLDLASDAQASFGLVFIPIFALVPVVLGGLLSLVIERMFGPAAPRKDATPD